MVINCKGELIDLSLPKVMGILNITPDSFFDGGRYKQEDEILNRVEGMLTHGATFIDVGAYSSRPSAAYVSEEEELERILPILQSILKRFPEALLSIDTFRSEVAKQSVEAGAALINDIAAGGLDEKMFEVVAKLQVPYIMMHMKGTPQTMQQFTQYDDILKEMLFYFSEKINKARSYKINDLIIDPGFGFSKTIEQNYHVFYNIELFEMLELPMLIGISRKSMIYKLLENKPDDALNGTTVLNTIALTKGANILRVHDVKEAVECIKIIAAIQK
ncbi:dihydropteroate synthase [Flavobacterium sp. '19STA2R22 D10 B1']|uniref:dihydropteroate synthase n=1 Tax=Flavobacterium aerium TaxID=3037261 RepID=UPI00278C34E9|nr:dihydropteroate synthase [Flavobacterium sp. '19STA2R22 D10 B1']